jgi:hypothetical protein
MSRERIGARMTALARADNIFDAEPIATTIPPTGITMT